MKKYQIGPVPKQVDAELIRKFESVEVATIGHFRHRGFVHHSISPVVEPGRTLVGTAVTVAIPATDSTLLHHAIGFLRPGDFLFVSSSLAGLVPAVLAGTSRARRADTPRTPLRTDA